MRNPTAESKCRGLLVALLCAGAVFGNVCGPARAAVPSNVPSVLEEREFVVESELIRRAQKVLAKMEFYQGPVDGRLNADLTDAVRGYQKKVGRRMDGKITEELIKHLETQTRVGVMLRHLEKAKTEKIDLARKALLENAETRKLLRERNLDEVANPTRDASPCFRAPGEACLLSEAVESAKAIHKPELRDWAFGEILVAQARAGLMDGAISTVRRIGDARLILVALRDIARAQARAGRIEAAEAAAAIIPDAFKRLEALSAIADIQLKNKDGGGAHETAARVIALSEKLSQPLQQITLLAQMAVILDKVGDALAASEALGKAYDMARSDDLQRQLGELERGAALRHVASAMAELGQPTRALEIIGEITGLYDRTAVQMSAAMALAEKGDAAEALKTAKVIESQRYQAVILGRIAVIQARAGDLAAADETIDEALDSTEQIKMSYAKSYAIGQLAQALVEIGVETGRDALAEAVKTAMEIENDRLRAYTLWTAAAAQRRKGFAAAARKTEALATEATEEIVSSLSQVWLYGDLASENAEAGQKAMAMAAFRKGIAIAESIHNAWGRARALAKLATALGDIQ